MKKNRILFTFLLLLSLIVSTIINASAETAKAYIIVSSSNIKVGDEFITTVSFSASSVGGIDGKVTYDSSILEYKSVSGSDGIKASGGAGVLILSGVASESISTMKFLLNFKAIKVGDSSITLSDIEVINWDFDKIDCQPAGTKISVKDTSGTKSSNAYLKSLTLSTGTLTPSFTKTKISYTVTVPYSTEKIVFSAVPEDSTATVTVNNLKSLVVGTNTQTISVTAADGTVKKYTVKITRQADSSSSSSATSSSTSSIPDSSQSADEHPIEINGKSYKLVTDIAGVPAPADCFVLDSILIDGNEVSSYQHQNADITLLYLLDENNQGSFFIYYIDTDTYSEFISIKSGENLYVVIEPESAITYQNFKEATITIGSSQVKAWNKLINNEASDFYMLYAVNPDGQTGWYLYDIKEKTLQRATEDAENALTTSLQNQINTLKRQRLILIVSAAVLFVLVMVFVIMILIGKKKSAEYTPRYIRKE